MILPFSVSAIFKGEWKCLRLDFGQTFCPWKCKENTRAVWILVIQRGYGVLWDLVVWASVALIHQWGRMGHHSSGYIFQSHHSSCDKINLIRNLPKCAKYRKQLKVHWETCRPYLVKSGGIWLQGLHLTLLGLKNPFGSGWCFTSQLFAPILISFCRFSFLFSSGFIPPLPRFASRISLAGQAGWAVCSIIYQEVSAKWRKAQPLPPEDLHIFSRICSFCCNWQSTPEDWNLNLFHRSLHNL